jgi:oligopeptide/dipeptide ABC transporter ATP-binding protein
MPEGNARAVDSLDMVLRPGEVVGLVGESGSGKTVTALSILGLIQPPGEVTADGMTFDGIDLMSLTDEEWSALRGARIAMIFQDPKIRLNPVFSVGTQIAETLKVHKALSHREAWTSTLALLRDVDLPDAEEKAYAYPHELSQGQAQRVMIALALALEPDLLIADEPTSSLDATIQAQILALIKSQQRKKRAAILLISHNLAVMAQVAQRVIVLYAGHILEQASVKALFQNPLQPYTQGLIASIPQNQSLEERLHSIPGNIPDARNLPSGCRFAPRCEARLAYELSICEIQIPELEEISRGHAVRCWLYQSKGDHKAPLEPGLLEIVS